MADRISPGFKLQSFRNGIKTTRFHPLANYLCLVSFFFCRTVPGNLEYWPYSYFTVSFLQLRMVCGGLGH